MFNDLADDYVDSHNPLEVELASTPWEREGRREKERGFGGEASVVYTCGQIFVDGARYREVPLQNELEPGHWHYDSATGRVYVHFGDVQPSDHRVELTTRRRVFAPTKRGLGYITVQGFIMEHCGNQYPTNFWETNANGQRGALGTESGHHWIIRRNLIRHAKTFAIDVGYVDKRTPRDKRPHDNLIEENYVVENGSAGILSNSSRNMVIRGNVILRNNALRFFGLKRWEQAGIKCHNLRDGLIEGNYVADNALTYGIWLDNQFPDSRVTRNVLVNNERAGIFLEMSDYDFDRLLVDNNVIVGNGENPVYIHDASGATFVHNLLANAKPDPQYGQSVFIRQVSARTKTYHHAFYNNLMLGCETAVDVNYPSHRGGPQRFDYNVYGCGSDARAFRINKFSDKPSPWSDEQFLALLRGDFKSAKAPLKVVGRGHVQLTFDQWRRFWQSHGQANDRHSALVPGGVANFDAREQTVYVDVAVDPSRLTCRPIKEVRSDFHGNAFPEAWSVVPGPFQSRQLDDHVFQVWHGLPILGPGKLPPAAWNQVAVEADRSDATGEALELKSPDDAIRVQFALEDLPDGSNAPVYRVWRQGQQLLGRSSMGLELAGGGRLKGRFEIVDAGVTKSDTVWEPVCGERAKVRDHYRQLKIRLRRNGDRTFDLNVTIRCYDEGVAFRYEIESDYPGEIEIKEGTEFAFLEDHTTWSTGNAQGEHVEQPLSKVSGRLERPLTLRAAAGLHVAIAEAAMDDYARMNLRQKQDAPLTLISDLAGPVRKRTPLRTPWRVVMIAESAGKLLENNDLIRNLNEPCAIADTSWIKPGKVIRDITLSTAGGLACVDFAVKHNLQYVEFDAGWYGHEYDDASDATTITVDPKRSPGPLDLHRVIRYADEKGIGVILYVNRRALEKQLDELLPLYKSWGVKGVKFGFVRVGTQQWTNWLHEAIRKAAAHRLMVDVHDEYRSTGYDRTYPNLMTVEGIGGDETSPSNRAALMNLFTRMLSGAADHKVCYFDKRVERNSSHACQLAKAVCFYDPWQFLYWYDSPLPAFAAGRDKNVIVETPELEFWDRMPTVWDDTQVPLGRVGEYAVVARRSGEQWFVGAINDASPRTFQLRLDFLEPGKTYAARIYKDDAEVDSRTRVAVERRFHAHNESIEIPLAANGGCAMHFIPVP